MIRFPGPREEGDPNTWLAVRHARAGLVIFSRDTTCGCGDVRGRSSRGRPAPRPTSGSGRSRASRPRVRGAAEQEPTRAEAICIAARGSCLPRIRGVRVRVRFASPSSTNGPHGSGVVAMYLFYTPVCVGGNAGHFADGKILVGFLVQKIQVRLIWLFLH